jgi:hypothetical protein
VYSIDTSKVTEDDTDEGRNGTEGSDDDKKLSMSRRITIEGMRLLVKQKKKAMLFEMKSMNENGDNVKNSRKGPPKEDGEAGGSVNAEEENSGKE